MKFVKTSNKFDDVKIFQGKLFQDSRGQFSKPFFGDILKNGIMRYAYGHFKC